MAGSHFCVSFAHPQQAEICEELGASVLWDNGGFTAFTKGRRVDENALYAWLDSRLYPPHRAIILDEIGGDESTQRQMRKRWPFPARLSIPVWHLNLSLDYLRELCDEYENVCFGSSGEYWKIGSSLWRRRMDAAFGVTETRQYAPWTHGLRMASMMYEYPFSSVDSTNVAQNWHRYGCAYCKSKELAARQTARSTKKALNP